MKVIPVRNVNEAFYIAMNSFFSGSDVIQEHPSRNGPMLEFDTPVTTVYFRPDERVLFDPVRDCNPFLHFFESLWMLQGREDLGFLTRFSKNMANFSDDGLTLNGAYGFRWRRHWEWDQIAWLIEHLKNDPASRRAVTSMWDPEIDNPPHSLDHPCNTHIYWKVRNGELHMTVCNRSNDAVWGCYGANSVHFSFLHEYVATAIGVRMGTYTQVSNSLHIYPELPVVKRLAAAASGSGMAPPPGHYKYGAVAPMHLLAQNEEMWEFDQDLAKFFEMVDRDQYTHQTEWLTTFFKYTVSPMWRAHKRYKSGDENGAWQAVGGIAASDWRKASKEWLERRYSK